MKHPTSEPTISVGLVESGKASITPIGEWKKESHPGYTLYTPLSEKSLMEISGIVFGKDFHWQSLRKRLYRGRIQVYDSPAPDGFRIINKLPLEQYIESVVVSEMHPDAPLEFIKAHAIISRTWALRKMMIKAPISEGRKCSQTRIITWAENDSHTHFDVCSDDHCQRYQGFNESNPEIERILVDCRGVVLMDSITDLPADTRFSKCCGGETEIFSSCWANSDFHYLTHISDPYCNPERLPENVKDTLLDSILKPYDRDTEYFRWTDYASKERISANLLKYHNFSVGKIKDIIPLKYGLSGRITLLKIIGDSGEIEVGKELAIRRILSSSHLLSSSFEIIEKTSDGFKLRGKGWGHGVGLCQIGAAVMAHEGKTACEILKFYFPGTKLVKIY